MDVRNLKEIRHPIREIELIPCRKRSCSVNVLADNQALQNHVKDIIYKTFDGYLNIAKKTCLFYMLSRKN